MFGGWRELSRPFRPEGIGGMWLSQGIRLAGSVLGWVLAARWAAAGSDCVGRAKAGWLRA
jgi:hypothetical protein